ncbi:hypothetical protein [Maribacter cobaltidurans]|nr:hypothetical protein [Maribacter cobaltidurans]
MKTRSLFICAFFLVITMASSLKIAGTMGYYALFTEDFVERFCENKTRPEVQCNGKCVLSKMLAKKEQEERKPFNLDWLRTETILFLDTIDSVSFETFPISKIKRFLHSDFYRFHFIKKIIIPPKQ